MNRGEPASMFRFLPVERVLHGPGAVQHLPLELDRQGLSRALVVTGATIAQQTDLLWHVEQLLGPRHAATYFGVRAHVPAPTVTEASGLAQQAGIDCVVSLGGGSAVDTAKAIAHRLVQATGGAPPAHLALPTTLSGAEFTRFYGVTDEESGAKRGAGDPALTPRLVILDPWLTLATPAQLWLSTGIKALDHAVEAFLAERPHPVTDALALEAVTRLFRWLPVCSVEPENESSRLECQIAAWMALFSPATVRGGLSHAIGHHLGAYGVPHGVTSCVTLSRVLRVLPSRFEQRQERLLDAMRAGGASEPSTADAVSGLVRRLELPLRLRDSGLPENAINHIADEVAHEHRGREPGVDILRLLRGMW